MQGQLLVTPERLTSTSGEFSKTGNTVKSLTNQMMELVKGLNHVWEGNAATSYMKKFNGLSDDIQRLNAMIQEHVKDLQEMAAEYNRAEKEAVDNTSNLSSDVIV